MLHRHANVFLFLINIFSYCEYKVYPRPSALAQPPHPSASTLSPIHSSPAEGGGGGGIDSSVVVFFFLMKVFSLLSPNVMPSTSFGWAAATTAAAPAADNTWFAFHLKRQQLCFQSPGSQKCRVCLCSYSTDTRTREGRTSCTPRTKNSTAAGNVLPLTCSAPAPRNGQKNSKPQRYSKVIFNSFKKIHKLMYIYYNYYLYMI